MYYEVVFRSLNKNRVNYLVAGGMAINLYGIPRFTKDLDLLIDESKINLQRLMKTLNKLGFKPKAPVQIERFLDPKYWPIWRKEKGMLALNFYNPKKSFEEIDLLVYSPVKYKIAAKRKMRVRVESLPIDLISLEDLIIMKKKAGREQDKADIESIKRLKKAMRKK